MDYKKVKFYLKEQGRKVNWLYKQLGTYHTKFYYCSIGKEETPLDWPQKTAEALGLPLSMIK